jgi:hypothetical protein
MPAACESASIAHQCLCPSSLKLQELPGASIMVKGYARNNITIASNLQHNPSNDNPNPSSDHETDSESDVEVMVHAVASGGPCNVKHCT